jgi:hypothetical protein
VGPNKLPMQTVKRATQTAAQSAAGLRASAHLCCVLYSPYPFRLTGPPPLHPFPLPTQPATRATPTDVPSPLLSHTDPGTRGARALRHDGSHFCVCFPHLHFFRFPSHPFSPPPRENSSDVYGCCRAVISLLSLTRASSSSSDCGVGAAACGTINPTRGFHRWRRSGPLVFAAGENSAPGSVFFCGALSWV